MANARLEIQIDSTVQDPELTASQACQAAAPHNAAAAEHVREPVTGKLLAVVLTVPVADASNAEAAIQAANAAGAIVTTVVLPPGLIMSDMEVGTVISSWDIPVQASGDSSGATLLYDNSTGFLGTKAGTLLDFGAGDEFVDGSVNPDPAIYNYIRVRILRQTRVAVTQASFQIANGDLSFTYDGGQVFAVAGLLAPIVFPALDAAAGGGQDDQDFSFWVAGDGTCYKNQDIRRYTTLPDTQEIYNTLRDSVQAGQQL